MRQARPAAVVLVAFGLIAGTLGASTPSVVPRRAGDYWILAADFHVHAFAGDGALAPWALRGEVARAGLELFALTNHNQTFTAAFARRLAGDSPGPMVLVGQEVTAKDFHISAVGIETTIDADQPAAKVIEDIHAQGGIAIANHPEAANYTIGYDDRALRLLDGFERAHPILHSRPTVRTSFAEFERRIVAVNPGVAFIGSSDFHGSGSPGLCRTYVLARTRTVASVLDAIREGRTVAADADGHLYGKAEYVSMLSAAGGYIAPESDDRWRGPSVALTWLGTLGLVSLSRRRSAVVT